MQAQKVNITLLDSLQRFPPVLAILCFHIVEILSLNFQLMKGEINLMPVRVGSHLVNQKNVDVSENFPNYYFFYLEILSIKLNELFITFSILRSQVHFYRKLGHPQEDTCLTEIL